MTTDSAGPERPLLDRREHQDRRAPTARVHFPERRLGFDRRAEPGAGRLRVAYLRGIRRLSESPAGAAALMISIVVLGIADMAFTFRALNGGSSEVNPLMAGLLGAGRGVAALVKIGITATLAAAGWWFRRFRGVIELGLLVAGLMAAVVIYHVVGYVVA